MALDFTNLQQWVDESGDLLPEAILSTDTLKHIAVQTNVSAGTVSLNVFNADVTDAPRSCDWNPSGSVVFDQINVTVEDRQIKQEMCSLDARNFYTAQRMSPTAQGQDLPFENIIADYYLTGVQKNIEDFIGASLKSSISVANGAQTYAGAAALTTANAVDQLNDLYDALDPAIQQRSDIKIVMSPAAFRIAVRSMVASDLIHYNFADGQGDVYLPGTDALLVKNSGLVGQDTIVAFSGANAIFATGLLDDSTKFNLFYDQGQDTLKATMFYRQGLGVYDVAKMATNGL